MALAIFLNKAGVDVCINEKETKVPAKGNAFLMHSDGVSVLNLFKNNDLHIELPGKLIDTFVLRRPDETDVKYLKLEPWQCIKRRDLINFLYQLLPSEKIKRGREFSHFLYEGKVAKAVVFANGETEWGDIFVGSDGANSQVRKALFGKTDFTPVEVKEIIGVINNPALVAQAPNVFKKYLCKDKGLSFGYIPTSEEEIVWFMQYDISLLEMKDDSNESMRSFCLELLKDFPQLVKDIIQQNDFSNSYIWNTTDFDLLPAFHKNNIVLIGDAAHLAVPFTSAGTTNALMDAQVLSSCILSSEKYEQAFSRFYKERATLVNDHTTLGRHIKKKFLNPLEEDEDDIKIPLIAHKEINKTIKLKKVHLLYFTDPVCSTCWLIQPQLRKLKLEYGEYLDIEYCMGGLLPSWENYKRGGISSPNDAAEYWRRASERYEMPINPDIWLENPLPSSYPPSIAFKAAQMQDMDKAIIFLRRINELLFVENKNIVENVLLYNVAYEVGLDAARLMRDLEGKAQLLFQADLELTEKLGIAVLPTFIFTDSYNNNFILKGYQEYESFETVLKQLFPKIKKRCFENDPDFLFKNYPTLTTKEFSFLSNLDMPSAKILLLKMHEEGRIIKQKHNRKGTIWKLNEPIPET